MFPARRASIVLASLALALLASPAPAGVKFVSSSGGDSLTLQTAIDLADDGDILVLAGKWLSFSDGASVHIDGKGLTLLAEAGAQPVIKRLEIRNVPAGHLVLVRGLTVRSFFGELDASLLASVRVDDSLGSVWFEDCTFLGYEGLGFIFGVSGKGLPALSLRNCAAVNVERCSLTGGKGATQGGGGMGAHPGSSGGRGVVVLASSVAFRECEIDGGGAGGSLAPGLLSGDGLRAEDSTVLVAGCEVHGAAGAAPISKPGSGLVATGSTTVARRGSLIVAGSGTPVMPDVDAPPGAVTSYPDPPRSIELPSPLHEGDVGRITVHAQPGDLLLFFTAFGGAALPMPQREGTLSLGGPIFGAFLLGTAPPSQDPWQLPFVAPDLFLPDMLGWTTLVQLVAVDGSGAHLEGTSSLVLLEGATVFTVDEWQKH